jgi:hypothetical protein
MIYLVIIFVYGLNRLTVINKKITTAFDNY